MNGPLSVIGRPVALSGTSIVLLCVIQGCALVGGPASPPGSPSGASGPAGTAGPTGAAGTPGAPGTTGTTGASSGRSSTELPPEAWTEVGVASWYGRPFHGRTTASGETYDMNARTGAHPTLPFGTRLRVENLENGRSAVLTVNDRGPFVDDRILDVSRKVAEELGMIGPGTARVRLTVLEWGGEGREGTSEG